MIDQQYNAVVIMYNMSSYLSISSLSEATEQSQSAYESHGNWLKALEDI